MPGSTSSILEWFRTLWPIITGFILAHAWLFRQLSTKAPVEDVKCLQSQINNFVLKSTCKDYREIDLEDRRARFGAIEIELREMRKEFRSGLDGLTALIIKNNGG